MSITVNPIGHVHSSRSEMRDDHWDAETTSIVLDGDAFSPDALLGLDSFSHIEVVYFFDQVDPAKIETGARHPRNNAEWPLVGIFAQRGKNRPNRLGVTVCQVLGVNGLTIEVRGLDAIDGTPVIDIKPVMSAFAPRGEIREPAWAGELMREYWGAAE